MEASDQKSEASISEMLDPVTNGFELFIAERPDEVNAQQASLKKHFTMISCKCEASSRNQKESAVMPF